MYSVLLAAFLATPPDRTFTFQTQAGPVATRPAVATDAEFDRMFADAQCEADRRGEAVACCQDGRLVFMVNPARPRKK